MTDYLLLFVGTVLVNNFVLVKFTGLCPFMGVSKTGNRHGDGPRDDLCHDAGVDMRGLSTHGYLFRWI